jgi:hypothetical protein
MRLSLRLAALVLANTVLWPVSASANCLGTLFRDGFEDVAQNRYEVELVVSQLGARSATFQLNGGETLTATGDGTYCFTERVEGGQPYAVAITAQPATGDACGGDLTGTAVAPVRIAVSCTLDRTEWDQFDWDGANWN